MSDIPKTWRVEPGVGLLIDDVAVQWPIAADPGPMVEPIDEHLHILWLPVFMDGPIPTYGRPGGEPVEVDDPNRGTRLYIKTLRRMNPSAKVLAVLDEIEAELPPTPTTETRESAGESES